MLNGGGYEQSQWMRLLFDAALQHASYDRLITLSGLDYPLWTDTQIMRFAEEHVSEQWLTAWDITQSDDEYQKQRVTLYHYFRDMPLSLRNLLRRAIICGSRTALKVLGFRKPAIIRSLHGDCDIWFSSCWIGITGDCARYIIDTLNEDKSFERYFRHSYTPDELLYTTLIMNSPFAGQATVFREKLNPGGLPALTQLHYIEYTDKIAVYSLADYDKLKASGKMFVRKLQSGISDTLVARLDTEND